MACGGQVRLTEPVPVSAEELADVDEAKALQLMAQYPSLIKRPVVDTGRALLVGLDPDVYAQTLK